MRSHAVLATSAVIAAIAVSHRNGVAHDDPPTTTIRAEDIGRRVQVIGKLGVPLRQAMSVTGTWVEIKFTQPPPKPAISTETLKAVAAIAGVPSISTAPAVSSSTAPAVSSSSAAAVSG